MIANTNCFDEVDATGKKVVPQITRLFYTSNSREDVRANVEGFFRTIETISALMGWRSDIVPSETCCNLASKLFVKKAFGYTPDIVRTPIPVGPTRCHDRS